jgi:DNA adenine methylase
MDMIREIEIPLLPATTLTRPRQAMEITSPPVRYTGSKWRIAPWVISHFPPHKLYCEPFCGGASVLFRKNPSKAEVINDMNGDVVNFFDVLRDRTDEFLLAITLTPFSRAELKRAHEPHTDDLERARRFYIRCWQKFTGGSEGHTGAWRYGKAYHDKQPIKDWLNQNRVIQAAERLRGVYIESDTAINTLKRFDDSQTLFYCDPPYVSDTCTEEVYANGMTDADHVALADTLNGIQGMALISGYDNPLYRKLYSNWRVVTTRSYTSQTIARTECLWINPAAQAKQAQKRLL